MYCKNKSAVVRVVSVIFILFLSACVAVPENNDGAVFPKDVKSVAEYVAEGDRLAQSGDLDASLVQFILALDAGDKSPSTYYKIGTIHRVKGDFDLANESFKQALSIDSQHVASREGLGLIHLKNENYTLADTILTGVVKDNPQRIESLNALGILKDLLEQYDEAQESYKRALAISPKSAKLLNNLGYSYYLEGSNSEAESQFRKSISADPEFDQAWSNLALVYARTGNQQQAQKAFEKVVSEHQALNNLAFVNMMLNNDPLAFEQLQESIRKAPSYYRKAHENLSAIDSDELILNDSRSEDGLTNIRSGLKTASKTAEVKISEPGKPEESILVESSLDSFKAQNSEVTTSSVTFRKLNSIPNESTTPAVTNELTDNKVTKFKSASSEIRYTAEQLEAIQTRLGELGYFVGVVDGVYGNNTRRALKSFQRDNAMEETGLVTAEILEIML